MFTGARKFDCGCWIVKAYESTFDKSVEASRLASELTWADVGCKGCLFSDGILGISVGDRYGSIAVVAAT